MPATKQPVACWQCGKVIKGKRIYHDPPLFMLRLGLDFAKAFHPRCYVAEEEESSRELRGGVSDAIHT